MNARTDTVKTDGPAAAAVLAGSVGVLVTGLFTTLAEISEGIKSMLVWYGPAGPLTGKAGMGIVVWLLLWAVLHPAWRYKDVPFSRIYTISIVLVALGWLLTFPLVFAAFGH